MNYLASINSVKSLDTVPARPASAIRAYRGKKHNARPTAKGMASADRRSSPSAPLRGAMGFRSGAVRTLMVPLDGSAFAERAIPLAVEIARRAGASLQIVHVHSPALDHGRRNHLIPHRYACDLQPGLRSHRSSYLERLVEEVRRESAIRVTSRIVDSSNVVHALCEAADEADLVVVAAHGKGVIRRWVYGSTVRQLVGKLSAPAIVVGSDGSFSAPPPQQLRRILIALDGSRRAERALGPAFVLGNLTNAESVLLRAVPISTAFGALTYRSGTGEWHNTPGQMQLAAADRYLRRLTRRMNQHANVVDAKVVLSHKSIARTIATNAEAFNADLVAIATGNDSANHTYPNIAERLVQFASMPVMLVPAETPPRRWLRHSAD